MMTDKERRKIQIRNLAREVSEVLSRISQLHEQLSQVLVDLDEAAMAADYTALKKYRQLEGRLLSRLVDEERQRLIVSEELGDAIGLKIPSQIVIDDVVEMVPEALAVKLVALRDRIQGYAYALRAQNRLGELLTPHAFEHVEVFLSPGAQQLVGDEETDSPSSESFDSIDPFDRLDPSL